MDVTDYLKLYKMEPKEFAVKIMDEIKSQTGIVATAGIGTNLYLAKVALDITAKHVRDNIGYLDEEKYCKTLWNHRPLTDFWRIGSGTVRRLGQIGIVTMGDIAHANEDMLYKLFGVDAELLIDHAWGREPVTMADIKAYKPKSTSVSSGQVLARDYSFEECKLIVKEMTDALCLEMAERQLVSKSIGLMIGYSNEEELKSVNGSITLLTSTNSYREIIPHMLTLYERIVEKDKSIRRLSVSCNQVSEEGENQQQTLFSDQREFERDKKLQKATLEIKKRFGNNALVRGMDLQEEATTMERNRQIGGHKSGE